VREKTAVDILNAAMLLLKLEGERFQWWQKMAQSRDMVMTPKGQALMEAAFDRVNVWEFRQTLVEVDDQYIITVQSNRVGSKEYYVTLPKVPYKGSYFGNCSCGFPAKEGIPCKHMIVVQKSSVIADVTRTDMMPHYWTTAHWKLQYAEDIVANTNINISSVKAKYRPNEKFKYCPDWSMGKKRGRSKKREKQMTVMERGAASSHKKRKRRVKMWCEICEKWNHTTLQCWKNPTNYVNRELETSLDMIIDVSSGDEKDGKEGHA
jgi:hypothetical protein